MNLQGPKYIHPESDIRTRPPFSSNGEIKGNVSRVFSGIGTFKNYRYHIELDPKVKPVVHPPRKIALSLQPKLEKKLDEMVKQGIIVPVDEATDLVNSHVVREKTTGSLRIYLDPKDLNKAIKREYYPVLTVDMVTNRLQGATHFSHLDVKSAYWNVELDVESSKLTTFNNHKGRFRFKKMPYGIRSSQDIYQKKMDEAFDKWKGAFAIVDDIQVYGNDTNHNMPLHEAMERTRQAGLKMNYDKCVLKTKSCTFLSNVYAPQGVMPDPKKVEAITKMQAPQTKQELQSVLGIVNYLGQFLKDMSQLTHNMKLLLNKNALFQVTDRHEAIFQKLKESMSSDSCLRYFDAS